MRLVNGRLDPPGAPIIEVGKRYIRIVADRVPPNITREHLPNVRRRSAGPSRWSVSTDWTQWTILWGTQARIRAGWPIAGPADHIRIRLVMHRVHLLDPIDNKGVSAKPVIDGLKRVWKRVRIAKGVVHEELGAGLLYEDDLEALPEHICCVRQVHVHRFADQRMVIELWRLADDEYDALAQMAAGETDAEVPSPELLSRPRVGEHDPVAGVQRLSDLQDRPVLFVGRTEHTEQRHPLGDAEQLPLGRVRHPAGDLLLEVGDPVASLLQSLVGPARPGVLLLDRGPSRQAQRNVAGRDLVGEALDAENPVAPHHQGASVEAQAVRDLDRRRDPLDLEAILLPPLLQALHLGRERGLAGLAVGAAEPGGAAQADELSLLADEDAGASLHGDQPLAPELPQGRPHCRPGDAVLVHQPALARKGEARRVLAGLDPCPQLVSDALVGGAVRVSGVVRHANKVAPTWLSRYESLDLTASTQELRLRLTSWSGSPVMRFVERSRSNRPSRAHGAISVWRSKSMCVAVVAEGLDPEAMYDELIAHARVCPTCWPWRNQLWQVRKLCSGGQELAALFAMAGLLEEARAKHAERRHARANGEPTFPTGMTAGAHA